MGSGTKRIWKGEDPPVLLLKGGRLALFPLGERSVLYSEDEKSLFGLDGASSFALLRLDAGSIPTEISAELTSLNPNSREMIETMVAGIKKLWDGGGTPYEKEADLSFPALREEPPEYATKVCLLGSTFAVSMPDKKLQSLIRPHLDHLKATGEERPDFLIRYVKREGGCFITVNGQEHFGPIAESGILPPLFDIMRKISYQRSGYIFALHAGVVEKNGVSLVFPGLSGSGKSTLCAGLLAKGWNVFSDEAAVVGTGGEVMAMPLGIGLKPGSWTLLAGRFPELSAAATWERPDGKLMRYLAAPGPPEAEGEPRAVIFPERVSGAGPFLAPIGTYEAIERVSASGYHYGGDLTLEKALKIIGFFKRVPAFALSYDSLGEAVALIDEKHGR